MIEQVNKVNRLLPTIGNLPSSYDESLSYLQMLMTYRKYLNNVIDNINTIAIMINDYDEQFASINNQINTINSQIEEINNYFSVFREEINTNVQNQLNVLYSQVVTLMNDYQTIFNNQINNLRSDLEAEIERVELGDVKAYNPTNGEIENISKVIMDVYDILRYNAITVNEFEALELTATEYDALEISAYNFDVNGKTFLLGN